tara:strand:- start:53 stop:265 length:213 start_codon:yes stop_codon:yes gene_type:complete
LVQKGNKYIKKEVKMDLGKTIKRIKELSVMLRAKTISDREKVHYEPELHRLIDTLEIPQLIGEFENEYLS